MIVREKSVVSTLDSEVISTPEKVSEAIISEVKLFTSHTLEDDAGDEDEIFCTCEPIFDRQLR